MRWVWTDRHAPVRVVRQRSRLECMIRYSAPNAEELAKQGTTLPRRQASADHDDQGAARARPSTTCKFCEFALRRDRRQCSRTSPNGARVTLSYSPDDRRPETERSAQRSWPSASLSDPGHR